MARAPLPRVLLGEMFLLSYDRESDAYTLFVDDGERSSYKLGSDVQAIVRWFRAIGHGDRGERAIDLAREHGAATASLLDDRVVVARTEPRRGTQRTLVFRDDRDGPAPVELPSRF